MHINSHEQEDADAWRITRFPRKPFGLLRMGVPSLRRRLGALPSGCLIREKAPIVRPGPRDVVVKVLSVALNFRDYAIALGVYAPDQPLPITPCSDAVGVVTEIGDAVTDWAVGDRVLTHYTQDWIDGPGTREVQARTLGAPLEGVLRSIVTVPEHGLVAPPKGLSAREACTLPIAGLTAWSALTTTAQATPGETVLLQGSGGVSLYGLQLAKALDLTVIVTTSSDAKAKKLKELGADHVLVTPHGKDWSGAVRRLAPNGVDIVLDVGGGATVTSAVKAAGHRGRIVCIGFLGGIAPKLPVGEMILNNLDIRGVTVGCRKDLQQLCDFMAEKQIRPMIDRVFEFDQAFEAFERLASGGQFGNICVSLDDTPANDH